MPNYKMSTVGCINLQLKKDPSAIWSCPNAEDLKIKLTRKRSSWHQGWVLPPKRSYQEHFCPFHLPSLITLFLILTPGRSLWFFCLRFALLWPGKIIALLTHVPSFQGRSSNSKLLDLPWQWWSYSCAHHKFLYDFQCLSFSRANSVSSLCYETP